MPVARPTPMDLAMHDSAQRRPSVSMTIGCALRLEGAAPPLDELRAHVAANMTHLPRLTYYLKGPGLRARWAREPKPDLERRVAERRIEPGDRSRDTALDDLATRPLPPGGPQWDLWLLHGQVPDRYTLFFRADHATFDGGGLRNTLYTLFGTTAEDMTAGAVPRPATRPGAVAYVRALRETLGFLPANNLWDEPGHPLLGARHNARVDVPTDVLRAIAAPHGGSGNDAVLAALAGALREWSADYRPRSTGRPTPSSMMVNLRRPEEARAPGNRFTFVPVPLPTHRPDPADRLAAVVAATRERKTPVLRAALREINLRSPARVFIALADRLTAPAHVPVGTSQVAFHRPMRYRDHPVTHARFYTWLPPSHPASIVACSYNGTTSVQFLTDRAVPGLHRLAGLWEDNALRMAPERGLAPPVG